MWIMTLDAICFLNMMRFDIHLVDYIYWPCRIDIVTSSAEIPATFLVDITQLGIFHMSTSRAMTDQAGEAGMRFTFEFFLDVGMTCEAILFIGIGHLPGFIIYQ